MDQSDAGIAMLDPGIGALRRAGAVSAVTFAVAYLVIIVLYVPIGKPPSGIADKLVHLAANIGSWHAILWLSVLTDFLLVPVILALHVRLDRLSRSLSLAAAAFMALFVILDLALTWTSYASLLQFAPDYGAAPDERGRELVLAAARYPAAIIDSTYLFVCNSLTLSIGLILSGSAMLLGRTGRIAAGLGLLAGTTGVVAVGGALLDSQAAAAIILASLLTMVWALAVGVWLWRSDAQA